MSTTANLGITTRGLNAAFFASLKEVKTFWEMLCMTVNSDGESESYRWLGENATPREWIGPRQVKPLRDYGFTIRNRHWESTIDIDRDLLDDDQTGQLAIRAAQMAKRFKQFPDKLLAELMIAGESTACYDGQYFFDTDHVIGDSGSQSNDLTYDVTTTTAPTAAEFEAAFWQAITAMAGFKDDQGEPLNMFQSLEELAGVIVLIPTAYMSVASKVLGASAAPLLSNSTNILAGRGKLIWTPRLSWTTKFAVFKNDEPIRPFVLQSRQEIKTEIKDDRDNKDIRYMADNRLNVGYADWSKAVLTTLT